MSFWCRLLWIRLILLKLTLIILVISVTNFILWVSLTIWSLMFSGIEFFEYFQSFLLLYIVVMNELWVVERDIGEGFTKVIETIHFVHELCRDFVALCLVSDDPYACAWWDADHLRNSWEQMIVYYDFSHALL